MPCPLEEVRLMQEQERNQLLELLLPRTKRIQVKMEEGKKGQAERKFEEGLHYKHPNACRSIASWPEEKTNVVHALRGQQEVQEVPKKPEYFLHDDRLSRRERNFLPDQKLRFPSELEVNFQSNCAIKVDQGEKENLTTESKHVGSLKQKGESDELDPCHSSHGICQDIRYKAKTGSKKTLSFGDMVQFVSPKQKKGKK